MPDEGRVSVSRGNPDLKPRLSDNLDASLEYHFDNGGSRVSVAAFHKNVKDMIYTQTQIMDGFVLDGETLTAEISSPLNASDASVKWTPDVNKLLSVELCARHIGSPRGAHHAASQRRESRASSRLSAVKTRPPYRSTCSMNFAALLRIVSASLVLACNLQGPALARDVTLATDEARARLERLIAIANDPSDPYVMVEAHRGAWDDARPENSIPAIEHAIGIGVDVIEFDIRETKDGHLVVMHDETVDRTTTITGKVVDLSLAEIVAARLETKDGRITDLHPPTLSEVLDVMKDRILFRPDIKCRPGCDDAVFNALIEKGMLWQAVTNPNFVARYREYGIAGKRLMVSGGQMLKYASDPAAMPAEVDWLDFKDFDGKDPPLAELRALKGRVRIVGFTYTDKRVGQRGDALSARDPDAGWGWLIDHGANILLTDTAEPLIGYLERRGLRTLR